MTDPTRPTTERTLADEVTGLRATLASGGGQPIMITAHLARVLCDAAEALSTAERHSAQLVELNMAWEAKARAMEEQRDHAWELCRQREQECRLDRTRAAELEGLLAAAIEQRDAANELAQAALNTDAFLRSQIAETERCALHRMEVIEVELIRERDKLRTANERLLAVLADIERGWFRASTGHVLIRQRHLDAVIEALTPRDPAAQGAEARPTEETAGKVLPGPAPDSPTAEADDEIEDYAHKVLDAIGVTWGLSEERWRYLRKAIERIMQGRPAPEAGKPTDGERCEHKHLGADRRGRHCLDCGERLS